MSWPRRGVDPLEYRLRYINDERASELMRSTAERAAGRRIPNRCRPGGRRRASKFPGFGAAGPPGWPTWRSTKASGEVAVTRIVVRHDAGMMVNPDGVRHQIHGMYCNRSRVLKERVTLRNRRSPPKNGGPTDPDLPEVPEVDVVMMPRLTIRRWAPGVGVGAQRGGIANAVFDATGIRFRELPITSDKLREALNGPDAERQAAPPRKRSAANGGSAARRGCSAPCWASPAAPCRGGGDRAVATPGAGIRPHAGARPSAGAAGDCAVCHSRIGRGDNAGGLAMATPFGTLYSTNITPDVATASATGRLPRSIGRCAGYRRDGRPSIRISLHRLQQNDRRRHAGAVRLSDVATGGAPEQPGQSDAFPV
ncbi:hypothetical protein ACF0H2_08545 [Serratia marcescens]